MAIEDVHLDCLRRANEDLRRERDELRRFQQSAWDQAVQGLRAWALREGLSLGGESPDPSDGFASTTDALEPQVQVEGQPDENWEHCTSVPAGDWPDTIPNLPLQALI